MHVQSSVLGLVLSKHSISGYYEWLQLLVFTLHNINVVKQSDSDFRPIPTCPHAALH